MAANVFVIDSSARRQQIKTTPGTYLRDVLEEACKKFGKDPEQFMLTDSSRPPKVIDLSLTLRLSGLVNGARLQLVQGSRSPSVINVAIKLPPSVGDGQRLQDKFPSNTSLWLVLRKFEEAVAGQTSRKLNLTQRGIPSTSLGAGRLVYEQPVVKIMQRELADFESLQKTLAQLGYTNGSVLLQLEFRDSTVPMEVAVEQISNYFGVKSPVVSAPSGPAHASPMPELTSTSSPTAANDPTPVNNPAEDTAMTEAPPNTAGITGPEEPAQSSTITPAQSSQPFNLDDIAVYAAPSSTTPLAALQSSSESDFIPTIEHAQSHQATLNRAAQNQRLLSDAELAAADEHKRETLSTLRSAVVRIRFPDQMQADLTVTAAETAAQLHDRVRAMLREPELGFELRYTGPKGMPVAVEPAGQQRLIRDLGWRGRVLVTMVWAADVPLDRRGGVLNDRLAGQARELSVPVPAAEREEESKPVADKGKAKEQKGNSKADVEAKMKKFLGFGKKK